MWRSAFLGKRKTRGGYRCARRGGICVLCAGPRLFACASVVSIGLSGRIERGGCNHISSGSFCFCSWQSTFFQVERLNLTGTNMPIEWESHLQMCSMQFDVVFASGGSWARQLHLCFAEGRIAWCRKLHWDCCRKTGNLTVLPLHSSNGISISARKQRKQQLVRLCAAVGKGVTAEGTRASCNLWSVGTLY